MSDNDTTQGFIDETDVEGHRSLSKDDGARQRDEAGPEGARRMSSYDGSDDDVEGHRMLSKDAGADELFRNGPSTRELTPPTTAGPRGPAVSIPRPRCPPSRPGSP